MAESSRMKQAIDYYVDARKAGERPYQFYVYNEAELLRRCKAYLDDGHTVMVKVYDLNKGYVPYTKLYDLLKR